MRSRRPLDLDGRNENLAEAVCEIEVCSLLAHVFNEIEHDLVHKTLQRELSGAERGHLEQLALLTRAGEIAIQHLLDKTERRLAENTGEFVNGRVPHASCRSR